MRDCSKIPRFREAVFFFVWGGGSANLIILGAGIFLKHGKSKTAGGLGVGIPASKGNLHSL